MTTDFFRRPSPSHVVKVSDLQPFMEKLEQEAASSTIEKRLGKITDVDGQEHDFSVIDRGTLRKRLYACFKGGNYRVEVRLSGVIDKPTVVYFGTDLAAAIDSYNDLG